MTVHTHVVPGERHQAQGVMALICIEPADSGCDDSAPLWPRDQDRDRHFDAIEDRFGPAWEGKCDEKPSLYEQVLQWPHLV
jgi:hypothetical protein